MTGRAWLAALAQRPDRPGPYTLELMVSLLERLGRPQDGFLAVHVAGTRGKGSTCALLAAALHAAGIPAGLTTSPHLLHPRERIRIDERDLSEEELLRLVDRVRAAAGSELAPSYFETLIAASFLAFAEAGLPLAVVEVGLGGRLDATVTCRPVVCGITRLGLEHRDRLGPDLISIAYEKAGILKPGVPAVLAPNDPVAVEVVRARAAELGAPLRLLESSELARAPASALPGPAQRENAALAWALLEELARASSGPHLVDRAAAVRGFSAVRWPARLERLRTEAGDELLVDVAHDLESLRVLVEHLADEPRALRLVFTCLRDKELPFLAGALKGLRLAGPILVPDIDHPRARPASEVVERLRAEGLPATAWSDPAAALHEGLRTARPSGELVVACGCFALAAEALRLRSP